MGTTPRYFCAAPMDVQRTALPFAHLALVARSYLLHTPSLVSFKHLGDKPRHREEPPPGLPDLPRLAHTVDKRVTLVGDCYPQGYCTGGYAAPISGFLVRKAEVTTNYHAAPFPQFSIVSRSSDQQGLSPLSQLSSSPSRFRAIAEGVSSD
ncbi:hypothetical protein [Leptolyngbya sp. PL-A3]|uniref:hypothetical protein n=1 Tax=Leptolyngbya sp. PL-A3 TaxID=2933911 RepID=UPI00329694C8